MLCGNCKNQHETVAEVRTCHSASFMSPIPEPEPATERQVAFLERLMLERPGFASAHSHEMLQLTKRGASSLIDQALAHPVEARTLVRAPETVGEITATASVAIPDGTFTVEMGDGSHVTLRLRQATWSKDLPDGAQVIEYLNGPDNELSYQSFAFLINGNARVWKKFKTESRLTAAVQFLLTGSVDEAHERFLSMAEAYALKSGKCLRCGKVLTVPSSLHRGLGPICAKVENVGLERVENAS